MNLNSFLFFPFFILVVIFNYILPKKFRWLWLLITSYVFYSLSDIRYTLVLATCTVLSYAASRLMGQSQDQRTRKRWMLGGVLLNLAILFVFKYFNFFFESLSAVLAVAGMQFTFRGVELLYPVGISFYIFQVISYLLDVFNGKAQAEKHFGHFALYVSFFPQLLIGPIERFNHLQPQLVNPAPFNYHTFINSLVRISWGFFKKIVIADRLAVVVNTVFNDPQSFESSKIVLAVLAFSFQIYIDFSAYCDIAIGTGRILGIDLVENFNRPYFAKSIGDFWRRWHISFSTWLRDYIFIPLNYRHRRKKLRLLWTSLDVMVTFLISGLWHGANWTFVIWGGLHGLYQVWELLSKDWRDAWVRRLNIDRSSFAHKTFQIVVTFSLVSFSWLFFRAESVSDAIYMVKTIFTLDGTTAISAWVFNDGSLGLDAMDFSVMTNALLLFLVYEFINRRINVFKILRAQPLWFRWAFYMGLIFAILIFGYYGKFNPEDFVYTRF